MTPSTTSLRLRLTLWTALLIGIVVMLVGMGTRALVHNTLEQQWLEQVAGRLTSLQGYAGTIPLAEVAPGLYGERYSGNYWQIGAVPNATAQATDWVGGSPSLGGFDLLAQVPSTQTGNLALALDLRGPLDEPLIGQLREVRFDDAQVYRLLVARDASSLLTVLQRLDRTLLWALALLWLSATLTASLAGLWVARPIQTLTRQLAQLRAGQRTRVTTDLPRELRPLADALNLLLQQNEARIRRQREAAANLAHELKTPLTALQQHAELHAVIPAEFVRERVARIWLPLEQELARARIHGPTPGLQPTRVKPELQRALPLCVADHGVDPDLIEIDLPEAARLPLEARDLFTVLWNLLDNALRHGGTPIRISLCDAHLQIEDAGRRGAASAPTQSGAGLLLVTHILDAYGWELHIDASPLGGRRCRLTPATTAIPAA